MKISITKQIDPDISAIYVTDNVDKLKKQSFSPTEFEYLKKNLDKKNKIQSVNSYFKWSFAYLFSNEKKQSQDLENFRKAAYKIYQQLKSHKVKEVIVVDLIENHEFINAFLEGLMLSNYAFDKYFSDKEKKERFLKQTFVFSPVFDSQQLSSLKNVIEGVYYAKNLVNEPSNHLNAEKLASVIQQMGEKSGFTVETLNRKRIEALKMHGLLAVNKGSVDPPTFSILEWKPKNPVNTKPIVLVGKGIVFDTGGISLKPQNYLTSMKSDMAGAAAVAGAIYAVAKNKLNVHIIGLVPATDNRVNGNAYVPDDIITMKNGVSVEIVNTDAEGRMILADALIFAKQYSPSLVMDIATLTGSASIAVGSHGIVVMGNAAKKSFNALEKSGQKVYERVVEFPFWNEYDEMIKSSVADIKNVGGRDAGAITAGKFLSNFVDYPWIHLDIAGPAFLEKEDSYRGTGGTGVGVRLFYDFLLNHLNNK